MIIIGINAYHADSSAAIFVNGNLIAAIEEERFTRIKHWAGFPVLAIEFCLQQAGIGLDQVDYFAIGRDSKAKLFNKLGYLVKNPFSSIGLITDTPVYLTPGTKIFFSDSPPNFFPLYSILEFNAPSTQTGTLALNEIKDINNKIELFPNPTNSKIALNSEKNYTIEIYDMQGQIVMKDKGNTVDLSNLSNAVYILKAYDNYEKTTTSYKVVKK